MCTNSALFFSTFVDFFFFFANLDTDMISSQLFSKSFIAQPEKIVLMLHTNSEGPDQPAHSHSLIRTLTVHRCIALYSLIL